MDRFQDYRGLHGATAWAVALALVLAVVAGCGGNDRPPLAAVHGRVTLDSKPLANAMVVFKPASGARESSGVTNENGKYRLRYIRDTMGGAVGANTVRITKQLSPDPTSEILPARYNVQSTLDREVKPGDNEINFDLTSNSVP